MTYANYSKRIVHDATPRARASVPTGDGFFFGGGEGNGKINASPTKVFLRYSDVYV